jgi:hypothetical protein
LKGFGKIFCLSLASMWPFRLQTIFKSRWWALSFVAFVCWQATQLVPEEADPASQATQEADAKAALKALGIPD